MVAPNLLQDKKRTSAHAQQQLLMIQSARPASNPQIGAAVLLVPVLLLAHTCRRFAMVMMLARWSGPASFPRILNSSRKIVLSASKCAALGAGRTGYTGCVSVPVTSSCAGSAATAAAALGLMLERGQHGTLLLGAGPLVHRLAGLLLALRCDGAEVLFLDNMAADAVSYHCWLKVVDITARDVGLATHAHTHTPNF